jgi:hypothetical protein
MCVVAFIQLDIFVAQISAQRRASTCIFCAKYSTMLRMPEFCGYILVCVCVCVCVCVTQGVAAMCIVHPYMYMYM